MWQIKAAINLCNLIQDAIYKKQDQEIISLIEQFEQWVKSNSNSLPSAFLSTWKDILALKSTLKKCKQSPNDTEAIDEAVKLDAKCSNLSKTVSKLKEILKNHKSH
jgi:tRNA U34 5-carboxymethylaminomethyl modifying GTPase MnmE/TrmE